MIRFDPNSAALTIHNLTAGYDRHPAIHHLTATIPTGSLVALLGPNGAGKTTLLRVLAGELLPMTGQITVPALWRGRIAYLPQRPSWRLEFPLTVEEAIALALWSEVGFWRPFPPSLRARIEEVLTLLELAPFARRPISHLSGGQQQRVRFAQLLIRSPALLLLDEPFTALDPPTIDRIRLLLAEWRQRGVTIIAALHDEAIARADATHALLLARELFAFGPTAELDWESWRTRIASHSPLPYDHAPWCLTP